MQTLPSEPAGRAPSASDAYAASTAAGTFDTSAVGDATTVSMP